jgi:Domain of unknown function (DUF4136)
MWKSISTACLVAALSGCAALNQLSSEVSTFNQWPSERLPASYTFDRLPSQQANAEAQKLLEDAAARALQTAGFAPAVDAKTADVTVQLGARVNVQDRSPFDDPFWWRGGLFRGHSGRGFRSGGFGFGAGLGFGFGRGFYGQPSFEREVAVLIRDKKTGDALYEARAANDGASQSINSLLGAMFDAALQGFPASSTGASEPRRVTTLITRP